MLEHDSIEKNTGAGLPAPVFKMNLPYPPTVNHYWRHYRGRTVISKEGLVYRARVVRAVGPVRRPLAGRLEVLVTICAPDRRRRDLDNVFKALLDALGHARVYLDDSQIDRLSVWRMTPIPPDGGVSVTIWEIADGKK